MTAFWWEVLCSNGRWLAYERFWTFDEACRRAAELATAVEDDVHGVPLAAITVVEVAP